MQEYQTWRELLAASLKNPREQRRIARITMVDNETLLAWSRNTQSPDVGQLHALLKAMPQRQMLLHTLIAEEFEDFDEERDDAPTQASLMAFSAHLLELSATVPEQSRFWSICTAVLSEALQQLDPDQLGISMSIVQCMSSQAGIVSCLRESINLGSMPWFEQVQVRTRFLGAESLAGAAVSSGSIQVITNSNQEQQLAINLPEHAVSAVALPITYGKRVAGCFLLASIQTGYFSSTARQELIENYRAMLTLAFSPDNFYEPAQIMLQTMPAFQEQQPYLSAFQQRIAATLKTAFSTNHIISYLEAHQHVCSQIAEELAQLHS
jgi:transcriptional regulator with GAF, ATPase, and Fis domain